LETVSWSHLFVLFRLSEFEPFSAQAKDFGEKILGGQRRDEWRKIVFSVKVPG